MTTTPTAASSASPAVAGAEVQPAVKMVALTIDGFDISVPEGTLIIRAAEQLGIAIPRFCDHPLLDPVGACRQCLVEITDMGNGRGMPKPAASCTTTVMPGMVVKTQLTSAVADKAQQGVMEMLLMNHPLDCPVCDKGGECPLQNQAMSNGREETRFEGVKRTYPKPINLSPQVLLDRERCVLCARCTRFSQQVAGDPFIEMLDRGALQQVGIYESEPFTSYFSGNTIQICPVGALLSPQYRFRARPFDLSSTTTICEHCASGCSLRADSRRGKVLRRWAAVDMDVNEEWNCDKGRWAFQYAQAQDRLTAPLVREPDGTLVPTSWPDALHVAARGLAAATQQGVGVLAGGRLTLEDAYAYGKFARVALGTNDVDFRARPASAEEEAFLGARVAGQKLLSYADLDAAPVVLLVGLEPEEESPILFLRLRKAASKAGVPVVGLAPFVSRGLEKLGGRLLPATPGDEGAVLTALASGSSSWPTEVAEAVGELNALLRTPGAVILVGERMATAPGAFAAADTLARETGARIGWVPRRAGERGALEAGLLPSLLPGGRPVADASARVDVATVWGVVGLPAEEGRDAERMLAAAASRQLGGLVVAGVDPDDFADPQAVLAALDAAPFVVSLELRASAVTERADVVFPVAPPVEKAGSYVDWEGRERPFSAVLSGSTSMTDGRVLHSIAAEMGVSLGLADVAAAQREIAELGSWPGLRAGFVAAAEPGAAPRSENDRPQPQAGEAVLSTWHSLLDLGRMQDAEPFLASTAKPAVARLSAITAAEIGVLDGGYVEVATDRGAVRVPVVLTVMPDRVIWLPTNSVGSRVHRDLGASGGEVVRIRATSALPSPAASAGTPAVTAGTSAGSTTGGAA